MSRRRPSIGENFINNMVIITTVSIGLLCLVWMHAQYKDFIGESQAIRERFLQAQKQMLSSQVINVVDYVNFMVGSTEYRLRENIRQRVHEAHQIATNIYEENKDFRPMEEIQKMVRDALRPIRFNNGRGYYFADSLDGTDQLYPVKPELEGTNILDLQDTRGRYVIREEIQLVRTSGEGFVEGYWYKPDQNNQTAYPKISFIKYFAPFDWYLGTGEYLDDLEKQIQNEVLQRIVDIRFGEEGYFFGSTMDGSPLFSNGKITQGTSSILDLTDPNGVKVFQEHRQAASKPEGGFVQYAWQKLDTPQPTPKISFVAGIEEWQWIIGAGVYLDTIDQTIGQNERILKETLMKSLFQSLLILAALLFLALVWARLTSRRIQRGVDTFSSFFKEAATCSTSIDPASLHFKEFQDLAQDANTMIRGRKQAEAEKVRLEVQLLQAQKLEAMGTLAGGIAHDFNNILGAILGFTELALLDIPPASPAGDSMKEVLQASLRAKKLVQQILTFSRKHEQEQKPIELKAVIQEALQLLRATLPSTVDLQFDPGPETNHIKADPTQIHQIMMNLCSNASQAVGAEGGIIKVSLDNIILTRDDPMYDPSVEPGGFLRLRVSDSGQGMAPDIMKRIFDPYYTTKEPDGEKGTGLGLSVVHGIVKSHRGLVTVDSQEGQGTTFTILFAEVAPLRQEDESWDSQTPLPGGKEHILFVDDELILVNMAVKTLERLGYKITALQDSREALRQFQSAPNAFDLVITDQTMPYMTGQELADNILDLRPTLPIIMCTGFSSTMNKSQAKAMGIRFLMKPLGARQLAIAIREALDPKPGH